METRERLSISAIPCLRGQSAELFFGRSIGLNCSCCSIPFPCCHLLFALVKHFMGLGNNELPVSGFKIQSLPGVTVCNTAQYLWWFTAQLRNHCAASAEKERGRSTVENQHHISVLPLLKDALTKPLLLRLLCSLYFFTAVHHLHTGPLKTQLFMSFFSLECL